MVEFLQHLKPGLIWVGADGPDEVIGRDSLMQTIRLDLRDPLRAARAALSVARHAESQGGGQGDALELEALFDRVDDLLQLADKLVDLASLWDGAALSTDDRIELWPTLQAVWTEVEPLALGRHVRVCFASDLADRDGATLYGSERWLRRVFVECLQGAVRWVQRGSQIEIEHLQEGARASIVIRDAQLFAAGGRGADAVGLTLCRHVLALHGGCLREQLEGRQRHLVIELPTGAPDPRLAVAQARQHAHDLAQLMTRVRRPAEADAA
jgi:K+-sensing histidine kinase KdpD